MEILSRLLRRIISLQKLLFCVIIFQRSLYPGGDDRVVSKISERQHTTVSEGAKRISFLYEMLSPDISGGCLKVWINDEKFQAEVISAMEQRVPTDKQFLLSVMHKVYREYQDVVDQGGKVEFNRFWARRAIRKLEASINGGDQDN